MEKTQEVPTLKQVEQQLLKQIVEFVAKREDLPVIREEENGNMIMRAVFQGTTGMTMVTEIKVIDNLYPEDFKYFLENWSEVATKLNP